MKCSLIIAAIALMLSPAAADEIFVATGIYAVKPVVIEPAKPTTQPMTHAEMVALHNRLHGGGSHKWPGDLASHLKTTHGISVTKTVSSKAVSFSSNSQCVGGICPSPNQFRSRKSRR